MFIVDIPSWLIYMTIVSVDVFFLSIGSLALLMLCSVLCESIKRYIMRRFK